MKNEKIMRRAVTWLARTKGMTREAAWVHVRTHGVTMKGISFQSRTPNAEYKRKEIAQLRANNLCLNCAKPSGSYARCFTCRCLHAERERVRIRRVRRVQSNKQKMG